MVREAPLAVLSLLAASACVKLPAPAVWVDPSPVSSPTTAEPSLPSSPDPPQAVGAPAMSTGVACAELPCKVDRVSGCGSATEVALLTLEELGRCLHDLSAPASSFVYRAAMLSRAFPQGALLPGAGEHLVTAGVLSEGQVRALAQADKAVARIAARLPPRHRPITAASCALEDGGGAGLAQLVCKDSGCQQGCRRVSYVITIAVEKQGLRLLGTSESSTDGGQCGCCM